MLIIHVHVCEDQSVENTTWVTCEENKLCLPTKNHDRGECICTNKLHKANIFQMFFVTVICALIYTMITKLIQFTPAGDFGTIKNKMYVLYGR